jgi:DNA repair exonuclease SbcCD ATPase subunit
MNGDTARREQPGGLDDPHISLQADMQRQMTELQTQWQAEKSAWETERASLADQIAALEKSKVQAEQDREFIREQYANASAYVTTVRDENKELEQRVQIAEAQSTKGVELIKATFESRVTKLQDEAQAWRKMAEFMIEKDTRTNDDVRRRAAEEGELRVLCTRQKTDLTEKREKMDELQTELQEKARLCDASAEELEHWKKENARLQAELNEALIKLDRIGRSGDESSQGDGHEFVYRCEWREETRDDAQSVGCPEVFVTMRVRPLLLLFFFTSLIELVLGT